MSLYLKYRPFSIDELDLSHVRKTLKQIAESGQISHAYLFDGPRGSGKTSAARILAKVANCMKHDGVGEPCGKCDSCLALSEGSAVDLIEIDAASNRGIDDMRELKQKIRLSPSFMKKKVYIIDEVHMLTTEAFNALLKTLEEPPSHALFVLCTTESHKLPETIISRCTRVKFRKATETEMLRSLGRVVKKEKVKVDDDALKFLASEVDGSFRDGVKILDQLISSGIDKIVKTDVEEILFGISGHDPSLFVTAMLEKDMKKSLGIVRDAVESGMDLTYLLKSSMYLIRDAMLSEYGVGENPLKLKVGREGIELIRMMDNVLRYLSVSSTSDLLIEMLILDWCDGFGGENSGADEDDENGSSNGMESEKLKKTSKAATKKKVTKPKKKTVFRSRVPLVVDERELKDRWNKVLTAASSHYSLEALLSSARLRGIEEGDLVIDVSYPFHKQQLESERFRSQVESLVMKVFSQPVRVRFELSVFNEASVHADLSKLNEDDSIAEVTEEDKLVSVAEEIFTQ